MRSDVESFHRSAGNVIVRIDEQRRAVYSHHLGVANRFGLALTLAGREDGGNQDQKQARPHQ
jgi:hypothetical protein